MAENQMDIARSKINHAYNINNKVEMLEARAIFERLLDVEKNKWIVNYFIAYCDYRLYTFEMNADNKKEAKNYINDGIKQLTKSIEKNPEFGEDYALMSSFYGGKIALFPISGMWNGPKSGKFMANAYKYGSDSPRIYLLDGISKYFTPEKWGGGIPQAELILNKAAKLYEMEDNRNIIPSWGNADVYTWLGIIETKKNNIIKAKEYFHKTLEIEPENSWVKNVLLPELE